LKQKPGKPGHNTVQACKFFPEFRAAESEAEVFEDKLEAILHITPPGNLLGDIRQISP